MRVPKKARLVARALLLKAAIRLRRYGLAAGGFGFAKTDRRPALRDGNPHAADTGQFALLSELDRMWREFAAEFRRARVC